MENNNLTSSKKNQLERALGQEYCDNCRAEYTPINWKNCPICVKLYERSNCTCCYIATCKRDWSFNNTKSNKHCKHCYKRRSVNPIKYVLHSVDSFWGFQAPIYAAYCDEHATQRLGMTNSFHVARTL